MKSLYLCAALAGAALIAPVHASVIDLTNFSNGYSYDAQPNLLTIVNQGAAAANGLVDIRSFEYDWTYAGTRASGEVYLVTDQGFPIVYSTPFDTGSSGWQTYRFDQPFSGFLSINVSGPDDMTATLEVRNMMDSAIAISPVPEPGTYAMLLAGLGLMGAVANRRASRRTPRSRHFRLNAGWVSAK